MSRKKRSKGAKAADAASSPLTVGLWYHPQHGAQIATQRPSWSWSVDGLPVVAWTEVMQLAATTEHGTFRVIPGQKLPKGYLWGNPSMQKYGLGGPFLVYAPIERRCHACKEMYIWSARAQKHLYETIGVWIDKTAKHCQSCARERRAREEARAAYATALAELAATPSGAAHATVATTMLAILEAGGRVSLEKAIGHCTRARRLGDTSIASVEAALRARR